MVRIGVYRCRFYMYNDFTNRPILERMVPMRTRKRASLREIARICNVSHTTVSRILNGSGNFSEETRRLVLDALAREGYLLDAPEQEGKRPASTIIGCLVADFTNEIFADRLTAIRRYLDEKGVKLCAFETRHDPVEEVALAQQLYRMGAAGILVMSAGEGLKNVPQHIPLVYMDYTLEELNDNETYCVSSDDLAGGRLAAQELLRKGCTKPLVLNIRYMQYWRNRRIQAFLQEFQEHGIVIPKENILQPIPEKSSFDSAKDLITYQWIRRTDFDSVFGVSDWRAYGALVALRNMGVRVPEEIKIVGYDGIRVSRYCDMPITTIQQNTEMLSRTACDMILSLVRGEPVEQHESLIPIRLQDGKTT